MGRSGDKIVVTGGFGFMGSHFVDLILSTRPDREIVVLDANTYCGTPRNLEKHAGNGSLCIVVDSVCHGGTVDRLVRGAGAVVHFAAETHVDRSISSARPFFETNVMGTLNVLESCRRHEVPKIVVVSSDEVYGNCTGLAAESDTLLSPASPYAASKAAADLAARSFFTTYDLPACIVRPVNNYGPRQYPEKLIPRFVNRMLAGDKVPVYGDGGNTREWLYVTDTCRAIFSLLEHFPVNVAGEVFNIGSGVEKSVLEITGSIAGLLGLDAEDMIDRVNDRPGHVERHRVDWSKIHRVTGWEPAVGLEEGLKRTIRWYAEHQDDMCDNWWKGAVTAASLW